MADSRLNGNIAVMQRDTVLAFNWLVFMAIVTAFFLTACQPEAVLPTMAAPAAVVAGERGGGWGNGRFPPQYLNHPRHIYT